MILAPYAIKVEGKKLGILVISENDSLSHSLSLSLSLSHTHTHTHTCTHTHLKDIYPLGMAVIWFSNGD